MPTNTYVELAKQTLTSNTGPVVFSNIPQTYTDLRIVIQGGFVDSGFMVGARVGNGSVDTGTNYSYTTLRGNGSSATSYKKANMVFGALCQQGGNNLNNVFTVDFMNYSNTTTYKTWISRYGNAGEGVDAGISMWRSTAAINTISIAECGDGGSGAFNYGNMLSGTTFSLYGIKAWVDETTPKATGGLVTSDSTYWYHTFTNSSSFAPNQTVTCDYLVVGGGGGGGPIIGGGGGAGGYRAFSSSSITAGTYPVVIGAGGHGGWYGGGSGTLKAASTAGNATTFNGYSSAGGGRGAYLADGSFFGVATSGGSGGGASRDQGAGSGNTPSTSPVQGYGGGGGQLAPYYNGGGGGGAGGAGSNAGTSGGNGGPGLEWQSLGTYYAGGGGASPGDQGGAGTGGVGGGGNGVAGAGTPGGIATGGGGGGGHSRGGTGGGGIVIVRYAK
jgi:hypothetical protein